MPAPIYDMRMADGSRHFASLPQTASWYELRAHLAALPGVELTGFITDHVTEAWIDLTYHGYHFSCNDQHGDYWLFVDEVDCPDQVLRTLVAHCELLLGGI